MQKRALTLRQAIAGTSAGTAVLTATARACGELKTVSAGTPAMDHIADAITKMYENRQKLSPEGDSWH